MAVSPGENIQESGDPGDLTMEIVNKLRAADGATILDAIRAGNLAYEKKRKREDEDATDPTYWRTVVGERNKLLQSDSAPYRTDTTAARCIEVTFQDNQGPVNSSETKAMYLFSRNGGVNPPMKFMDTSTFPPFSQTAASGFVADPTSTVPVPIIVANPGTLWIFVNFLQLGCSNNSLFLGRIYGGNATITATTGTTNVAAVDLTAVGLGAFNPDSALMDHGKSIQLAFPVKDSTVQQPPAAIVIDFSADAPSHLSSATMTSSIAYAGLTPVQPQQTIQSRTVIGNTLNGGEAIFITPYSQLAFTGSPGVSAAIVPNFVTAPPPSPNNPASVAVKVIDQIHTLHPMERPIVKFRITCVQTGGVYVVVHLYTKAIIDFTTKVVTSVSEQIVCSSMVGGDVSEVLAPDHSKMESGQWQGTLFFAKLPLVASPLFTVESVYVSSNPQLFNPTTAIFAHLGPNSSCAWDLRGRFLTESNPSNEALVPILSRTRTEIMNPSTGFANLANGPGPSLRVGSELYMRMINDAGAY